MTGISHAREEQSGPLLGALLGDAARTRLLPDRPPQVTAVRERAGIFISWGKPPSPLPVVGYRIYRRREMETPQLLTTRQAGADSYLDQNVTPGTAYYYSVTAVSSSGEGVGSSEVQATAAGHGRASQTAP